MSDMQDWMDALKKQRDEMLLQMHLGTKEAKDEWKELMGEWDKFLDKSELDKSAEEVGESAKQLGLKMKEAYDRARKAL